MSHVKQTAAELASWIKEQKLAAFDMALRVERLKPEQRRMTGYRDGGDVIMQADANIESALRKWEKANPA